MMGIMASCSPSKEELFDPVRKKWVAASKEEEVRQRLIWQMVSVLHYPLELLSVEKEIEELPGLSFSEVPKRRIDVVSFFKKNEALVPLLLIECKEGDVGAVAFEQVIGYNSFVKAPYIAVAFRSGSLLHVTLGTLEAEGYVFTEGLPSYTDLLKRQKL